MILLDFVETVFNFIDTFKVTWNEINKDKKRSKDQIQEIKSLANAWKKRAEDIKNVENILKDNWEYLPVDQRKDYIQKTIDLIHHGFNVKYYEDGTRTYYGGYVYGLINIYEYIHETILYEYSNMKNYYNSKDYEYVNRLYENCIKQIDKTLIKYNIKQNSST